MTDPAGIVRLGTRGSALARWQTDHVAALLQSAHPNVTTEIKILSTRGDQVLDKPLPLIGGKGLFTAELEAALRDRRIDLAVHSLKDLPTEQPRGLTVGGVPARENVADVLVSRDGHTLYTLPKGATIGTSSRRRAAQLKVFRPDLQTYDIRGNVGTRVKKALDPDGPYDAIVLAYAGLVRLGNADVVSQVLPLEVMLPAPGQGALGIQSREESEAHTLLQPITDTDTLLAVVAEREFLAGLGGGCAVPIAAYAEVTGEYINCTGRVAALDGSRQIEVKHRIALDKNDPLDAARELGHILSKSALDEGAREILEAVDADA
jgi:hydroxymethylbilane synthase